MAIRTTGKESIGCGRRSTVRAVRRLESTTRLFCHTLVCRTRRIGLASCGRSMGYPSTTSFFACQDSASNAMPLAVKQTLTAIEALHRLGSPVILDHVGGLVGLSALAFGFASGIAHGVGERYQFNARDWHKLAKKREKGASFGRPVYLPLPGLDKAFRARDLRAIASSTGGRRLVACPDRGCCPRGLSSMLENPRAHIARQQFAVINRLASVPDTRGSDIS